MTKLLIYTTSTYEEGHSALAGFEFKKGSIKNLLIDPEKNKSTFDIIEQIIPRTQKTMDEARGFIIADYQSYLEKEWISALKSRYKVRVNQDVFESLVKKIKFLKTGIIIHMAIVIGISFLAHSCARTHPPLEDEESVLLAEVFNRKLYRKDLEGLATFSDRKDSIAIAKAFIDRWTREQVLLHEAELNIPPDLEINKLVRDYRSSLIINNYKQQLISTQMDSIVSENELIAYYNENKEQYHLENDIVQLRFVRIDKPVSELNTFRQLWAKRDSSSLEPLIQYCQEMNYAYILQDSVWHDLNDLLLTIPIGELSSSRIKYKKNYDFQDTEHRYFIWIINHKEPQDIAPLRYIQEQARRVLLHRKQQDLVSKINEDLLDQAIRENKVKIYN